MILRTTYMTLLILASLALLVLAGKFAWRILDGSEVAASNGHAVTRALDPDRTPSPLAGH
jgi:hypothetical protein